MIIVSGAAGFIGSCLIGKLNSLNFNSIIAVDNFDNPAKNKNLAGKIIEQKVPREQFFNWMDGAFEEVEFIFHIGARTDTAEFDTELLWNLNTNFTKKIWQRCVKYQIPLVYAPSAAT